MKGKKIYQGLYTIDGGFEARGGFATVYSAVHRDNGQQVAIKVAQPSDDPGIGKSIREEARILHECQHQHIVKLIPLPRDGRTSIPTAVATEIDQRSPFFVMEFLSGGNLEDYLKGVGVLSVSEAATIGLNVALALYHLHTMGYAHNDLKLENIVFRKPVVAGQPFEPVLVDFGIATRVKLQLDAGSIYIMPPEQIQVVKMSKAPEQVGPVDNTKVDVWGLGVVLYRMLGGRLPFDGRTDKSVATLIVNARPTSLHQLSGIPHEVDDLILDGCLAKEPAHRLTMVALGKELRRLAGTGVVASKSAPPKSKNGFLSTIFRRG